jgi:formate C-acetyltransferase
VAVQSLVIRRARAFARTLAEMPIAIDGDELIVGRTARGDTIVRTSLPPFATAEEHARARAEGFEITARLSHKTPDYPTLLTRGLRGVLADVAARQAELGRGGAAPDREEQIGFLESVRIECEAVVALAHRFADEAERLAPDASPERAADLRDIAAICRRVPEHPARTLHEALQSVWLAHYAFFSTSTGLSLGRLDQYCGPFLRDDLAAGRLTLDQARELLACLWLKFNDRAQIDRDTFAAKYDDAPWPAGNRVRTITGFDRADAINHFGQNVVLSGLTPDGQDGTNDLTYLCLDCCEQLEFTSPVVTVRLHRGSPPRMVERCAVVLKRGGGMP